MGAADTAHAQASDQVHTVATAASAALNKLALTLKNAGVPDDVVKAVDAAANMTNDLASAAVGNAPVASEPAPDEAAPGGSIPGGGPSSFDQPTHDLQAAMQAGP